MLTVEANGSVRLAEGVGGDAGVHPDVRRLEVPDLQLHPGAVLTGPLLHHHVLVTDNDTHCQDDAGDGIDDGERGRINIFLPSIGQTGLWWPVT